jgi:hypothetical protein
VLIGIAVLDIEEEDEELLCEETVIVVWAVTETLLASAVKV